MKILLVNVDSVIPNLALEKIKIHHRNKGHTVFEMKDQKAKTLPLLESYDKIYVSCVFDYNKHFCKKWEGIAEIGGSGYSLSITLPPIIDKTKPKINFGFTTRGCIRNCYFCIVRKKEGKIKAVGDIYDFWDGESKEIVIMDNNILALPKHFMKISKQLKKENLIVDFNQGLDCRLLNDELVKELMSLKYKWNLMRFAFDSLSVEKAVLKSLNLLKKHGLKTRETRWYVYVGVDDTKESVLHRVNIIREYKQPVYLMLDKAVKDVPVFKQIKNWCNFIGYFMKVPYEEFDKKNKKAEDKKNKQNSFFPK